MSSNNRTEDSLVELKNVSKVYGEFQCIKNVCLRIHPSETICVLGENGSGKTSLIDLITGFVQPDSGDIFLGDCNASGKPVSWFAKSGIIRSFQTPRTFAQMSVWDVLKLSLDIGLMKQGVSKSTQDEMRKRDRVKFLGDFLDSIGWSGMREKQAGKLSYGQKKLLSIMQIKLIPGKIAVCDEPTAGLDEKQSLTVVELLDGWKNENIGSSVLLATHDSALISRHSQRVLKIYRGELLPNERIGA